MSLSVSKRSLGSVEKSLGIYTKLTFPGQRAIYFKAGKKINPSKFTAADVAAFRSMEK